MRALLFCVLAIVVLALVGWVTFSQSPDKSSINVETNKIERDTEELVESGKKLLEEAGEAIDRVTDDEEESTPETTTPENSAPATTELEFDEKQEKVSPP